MLAASSSGQQALRIRILVPWPWPCWDNAVTRFNKTERELVLISVKEAPCGLEYVLYVRQRCGSTTCARQSAVAADGFGNNQFFDQTPTRPTTLHPLFLPDVSVGRSCRESHLS